MASRNVTLSATAYLHAVLHSVRHPTRPVFSILVWFLVRVRYTLILYLHAQYLWFVLQLGRVGKDSIDIDDAIPAFHSNPLAPVLEMCFLQVEEFARTRDMQIVGITYGNELDAQSHGEGGLTSWPQLLGNKIAENFSHPLILNVRLFVYLLLLLFQVPVRCVAPEID